MQIIPRIEGLSELAADYDAILCDVWGVLHNGMAVWPEAAAALQRFRETGGVVIMITNAPRPREPVMQQLENLLVPDGVYDNMVTSGDVTRNLIEQLEGSLFHIGPERDFSLYEGLDVTFSEPEEAVGVVCTGLFDDRKETLEDYRELLDRIAALELPFICANPDIVVEYGDRLLWCAGALARDYAALGGDTRIVGKPHAPIYEHASEKLLEVLGEVPDKSRILAIGDGLPTDLAGARDFGIDALFVSDGIHLEEYKDDEDGAKLQKFLAANKVSPAAWLPTLVW